MRQRSWLKLALRTIDGLSLIGALMAGVSALLIAFIVCYEVLARTVFNAPTAYSLEISSYLLLGIAFLGAAYGVRESGHVQMDVLVNRLSERWRLLLDAFTSLLALVFALVFAWVGWEYAFGSYQSSSVSATTLQIPLFLPQLMLPIGGLLLVLQLLARIVRDLESALLSSPTVASPEGASTTSGEALSDDREKS